MYTIFANGKISHNFANQGGSNIKGTKEPENRSTTAFLRSIPPIVHKNKTRKPHY